MSLTPEDVTTLNGLFPFEQHEFNRGFVYITEQAVCVRLEAVDPSWNWDIKSVQVRDNDVVVIGTLTVKGVTREGVGMDKIQEKAGEAEKSAATDALKRAARLFGIGRYLLDNPKEGDFKAWLAKQAGKKAPPPPAPTANGLTRDDAITLEKEAGNIGVGRDQLLTNVLQVEKYGLYTGTLETARQTLREYVTAVQNTPAKPLPEGVFAGGAK